MIPYLDDFESLPLRGKVSLTGAYMRLKVKSWKHWWDWDVSNRAHNEMRNKNAKNSKAKHRKKYKRK